MPQVTYYLLLFGFGGLVFTTNIGTLEMYENVETLEFESSPLMKTVNIRKNDNDIESKIICVRLYSSSLFLGFDSNKLVFQYRFDAYFLSNITERSNLNFGSMIGVKILPKCNGKWEMLKAFYDPLGNNWDKNYGCWCGAGTINSKMHQPQNVLDRICRAHDICYDRIGKNCPRPYDLKYKWSYKNNVVNKSSIKVF